MQTDKKRSFKNQLYEQFARLGKALASPHRLELLDVLAQCERTVEALAQETGMSVANASQHLQVLRAAHLVIRSKHLTEPLVLAYIVSMRTKWGRAICDGFR
jgi:DNA-binding transcriptional ArsR family regulator